MQHVVFGFGEILVSITIGIRTCTYFLSFTVGLRQLVVS